ncbi:MAG: hypothetical protein A2Z91_05355 [Deltaproteobacteria bacterium GWA2_38_16]|nr:MAG: hypothetical protein A2Z91_05355 [Deltaproteobacteria bacterium GWA2_38_16]OGQ03205.1 MAG: hypothetical protein A3D19_04085 [Deltaproteobacteria bacterium RIFCSPHIGHO2_02_FULL_38_15]OGQ34660.1 MAG: hypothetical protein A3A72_00805 [Deltaproteobacteria bacterium RIFCSPLOWO2_01_FULL_38_9]OGQ59798.1 MAG: hypothetical protein A3G92_02800 [Deltaproteobacteria bacterium RIFCSPLOWO2_12_FULL_38_8]HBQ20369.1 hypothetical protein [Deltaproteobacteria bacterium]
MKLFIFIFTALTFLYFTVSHAQEKTLKPSPQFAAGEVLLKFKPKTPKRIILALKESLKVTEEHYTKSIDLYHWKGNFDTETAIQKLQKSKHVLYAEPNYKVQIQKKKKIETH